MTKKTPTKRMVCNLGKIMKEKGETVHGFSKKSNVSRPTLYNILNDEWHGVSRRSIENICNTLSIDIQDLFSLESTAAKP